MSEDPLSRLETWVEPLLQKLQPGERRQLAWTLGRDLRQSEQQRIARQENPDGTPYTPRKDRSPKRSKAGRIKRRAMFTKLRTAKHLRVAVDREGVSVGFVGRVARIALVHQDGAREPIRPGGPVVQYPRRELLGFTERNIDRIRDHLLEYLGRRG